MPRFRTISFLVGLMGLVAPLPCVAQTSSAPAPKAPPVRWQIRDTTRAEVWRFFEPQPGGGNPDYSFLATRLSAGVDFRGTRVDAGAAVQYVQFGGLPADAVGPGPLGTGPQYYDQAGRTDSHQLYLRSLQVRFKNIAHGVSLQLGRFGYASGAESASGDPKIETVKRQRLDSRLIGEFEWSLYQRAFDGGRIDIDRARWHGTALWSQPTQGGFEDQAGRSLRHVHITAASFSLKPNRPFRHTDVQAFAYRYDDTRAVRARPDNTLLAATSVDVHINSFGTSLVGVYPAGRKAQVDVLGWLVGQSGTWYGQGHRANAAAAEVGYQRPTAPWRPWLRAGWIRSTGDSDAKNDTHGTFFQMLPTTRRYALSTAYNLMNLTEFFGQTWLRPRSNVGVRVDVHRLRLTQATDLWYAGSGATQRSGTTFGFAGRRSNGSTKLGTMVEGSADWTVTSHFTVNGYLGRMQGGDVVGGTFAGTRLRFGYVETVVSF